MADKYISGEEYQANQVSTSSKPAGPRRITMSVNRILVIIIVILLCAVSFWAGTSYQKHHAKNSSSTARGATGSFDGQRGFARRGGGIGQVTSVSSSNITITNQRTGNNQTFSITSSTVVTDSGQTSSVSAIQTGDTVLISTSGSGSTTATRILINPSFGGGNIGGPADGDNSSSSSNSSDSSTQTQ